MLLIKTLLYEETYRLENSITDKLPDKSAKYKIPIHSVYPLRNETLAFPR